MNGATGTSFVYDGDGNRVKTTFGTAAATYYVGNHFEWTGSTSTMVKYYYAGGQRVAMRKGGVVYYLHGDHLGSTSLTTCGSTTGCGGIAYGAEVVRQLYYPYGEMRWPTGGSTLLTDYAFTGQRNESSFKLMDYNARYYDPSLNHFISPDAIVPSPQNPQSLNRYSYVLNNPLKYIDPTGHDGTDGGVLGGTSSDPNIQLEREKEENELYIVSLIQTGRWNEYRKFMTFMQKIHPGSIGVFKWSGYFPGPGDVGHAVVGVDEGVFIGTGGYQTDYGVYMSSAAETYQNEPWLQQLSIYEVQGMSDQGRKDAAKFALNEYGAGYSYAGLWSDDREASEGKKWYCSELTVAALEGGGATFYSGNGVLYGKVRSPGLPVEISNYRTIVGQDATPAMTTRRGADSLIQTWP